MKKVFHLMAIIAFSSGLHAQESCIEKLYHAHNLYEKGLINEEPKKIVFAWSFCYSFFPL
jgi:hypothetical protein